MTIRTGTREQWLEERKALLRDEKALMRYKDHLAARRQALPWVKLDKQYSFQGDDGPVALGDLFGAKSQLIVYHFMFGPDWDNGCPGCSQVADAFNFSIPHLETRDATLVAVSRTSRENIRAFRDRMGWRFPWLSSLESDFNFDFDVSFAEPTAPKTHNFRTVDDEMDETHGISVFAKHDGDIYHTYSCYARAVELVMVHLQYLDLVPKGREAKTIDEIGLRA